MKKKKKKKNNTRTEKGLLDKSIVRIGLKKTLKKEQHAHTKSVARLVDSENWSKKKPRIHKNCC